jgi:tetratricopeptide (TPR) repeat protein
MRVLRSLQPSLMLAIFMGALSNGSEAAKLGFSRSYCLSETLTPIEAISSCTAVLQKFHRNASVLIRRGAAFAELGEFDYAVGDFSRAINIDKTSTLALQLRGIVLEMQGQYQESLIDYMKVVELSPSDQEVQAAILRVTDAIVAQSIAQEVAKSPDGGGGGNVSGLLESTVPSKSEPQDRGGDDEKSILIAISILILAGSMITFRIARRRS